MSLTLRSRLAIVSAATTALAAIAVSLFGYALARSSIVNEIDSSLVRDHSRFAHRLESKGTGIGIIRDVDTAPIALVNGDGRVLRSTTTGASSVNTTDGTVASGKQDKLFSNREVDGKPFRFYSAGVSAPLETGGRLARFDRSSGGAGLAIVVGRNVEAARAQLGNLAVGFSLLALAGTSLSAIVAFFAVRRETRPLDSLHLMVQAISTDGDSPFTAPLNGPTDIAQLSAGVNTMLESLRDSRATQQRMIDDAAHELRTPLTSMQTNLDILARADQLDPAVRADIVRALLDQFRELRTLVDDLGLLAEDHLGKPRAFEPLDLSEIANQAVARAQRRGGVIRVNADLQPFSVLGDRDRLERAIINILDNAIKWSPPHEVVSVTLRDGELQVADAGPGVEPDQRAQVFDRFWRATDTRNTPGSGLGLAIVADVVAEHCGTVEFGESSAGGALVTVRIPHHQHVR